MPETSYNHVHRQHCLARTDQEIDNLFRKAVQAKESGKAEESTIDTVLATLAYILGETDIEPIF